MTSLGGPSLTRTPQVFQVTVWDKNITGPTKPYRLLNDVFSAAMNKLGTMT